MLSSIKGILLALKEILTLKATIVLVLFIFSICVIVSNVDAGKEEEKEPDVGESLQSVHIDVERFFGDSLPDIDVASAEEKKKLADASDWRLTLVNAWNPIPEDWEVELVTLKGNQKVDKRCYAALQEMMNACRSEGLKPMVCSSYRTQEFQQGLFDNRVGELMQQGLTRSEAEKKAATSVAVPGTSEHQLGIAVDIVDEKYQAVDASQEKTEVQKWMMKNSWRYGFVLRYPNGKSNITGIIYEPWHYRYVGEEAAREMHQYDVCLEEYLQM